MRGLEDFRFGIDSTDKSGGLYHQEIFGQDLPIEPKNRVWGTKRGVAARRFGEKPGFEESECDRELFFFKPTARIVLQSW